MADRMSKEQRHKCMSCIKSKDTNTAPLPEGTLRMSNVCDKLSQATLPHIAAVKTQARLAFARSTADFHFQFSPFTFKQLDRHTTLQALEQTLNKIFLLNNGAKITASYSNEENSIGMVAEE